MKRWTFAIVAIALPVSAALSVPEPAKVEAPKIETAKIEANDKQPHVLTADGQGNARIRF
ncbi:hypothetical protein [Azospirillum aestuarii]|uniref:hypothetical protein n=1 Tax=Azospirillum aestuarii TaxID=2802052 RepID=UPI00405532CF